MADQRPIGVFDSGIGGLTVLKVLAARFPNESFLYLGDTARLPYGSKSTATIRKYSEQNIDWLCQQNVKAVVIACNSASTSFLQHDYHDIPIYNVIEPGAKKAAQQTKTKRIGVLGTRATVKSDLYKEKILAVESSCQVFSQACPLFVPLAEENLDSDPVTNLIVFRYLNELIAKEIDVLVLGCTHYPLLKNSIAKVAGPKIQLIDSGDAIADWIQKDIDQKKLTANTSDNSSIRVCTTDASDHFQNLAETILNCKLQFEVVNVKSLA